MSPRIRSLLGTITLVAAIGILCLRNEAFGTNPLTIGMQVGAFVLMVWARLVFGMRSFNATAGPTEGGLITRGPYGLVRNPIYAAVLLFLAGSLAAYPDFLHAGLFVLGIVAVFVRILAEEGELRARYGAEYEAYTRRVRRLVPWVV